MKQETRRKKSVSSVAIILDHYKPSRVSGVAEHTILEILAGIREPELNCMCKLAEGFGICVHELRADEESYVVTVQKDTPAKLIVVSEMNGLELEELIHRILEKGIEEYGF